MIKQAFLIFLKKTHLNTLIYYFLKPFYTIGKTTAPQNCNPFDDNKVKEAQAILNAYHHNVTSSSLTTNHITPQVDLQLIIPVYNTEKYVVDCINSTLSQNTRYSYIITIINDGSPDRSRELIKQYESNPLVEIIDQENKGFSGARNRGLSNIKGRYISFLDSDDKLHNGAIDALMDTAIQYDADIVQGGYFVISEKGKILKTQSFPFLKSKRNPYLKGFPWGKVFKASLFENIHFPEGYWFEDTICSYLLFPLAQVQISIENIVYEYRKNKSGISFTSKKKPKSLDTIYITEALIKDAFQLGIALNDNFYAKQFHQMRVNYNRISTLNNPRIEKAAFVIHCHLIERYFHDRKLNSNLLYIKELELAVKSHNYKLYRLAGNLL